MKNETLDAKPIPVEEVISTELTSQNITKTVLAELKKFTSLTIKGIDDKEGYQAVHRARIQCRDTRTLAVKVCKKGREEANAISKAWIAKEKEVVSEIESVEKILSDRQQSIDDEIEAIAEAERQKERDRIDARIAKLRAVGYELSYDVVSSVDDETFEATLKEATGLFSAEQERVAKEKADAIAEANRIEAQRIENEKESQRLAKIKADQEAENLRIENERAEAAAKLKAEQDAREKAIADREAKIKAEEERVEREKKEAEQKIIRDRELKEAAEKALADAEEKRIADELAAKEKQEAHKKEAARLEALKPDKEKIIAYIKLLSGHYHDELILTSQLGSDFLMDLKSDLKTLLEKYDRAAIEQFS